MTITAEELKKLKAIFEVFDGALGDSDPDAFEDEEDFKECDPFGWAANKLSEMIQAGDAAIDAQLNKDTQR